MSQIIVASLEDLTLASVLRFYRAVSTCDRNALSEARKKALLKTLVQYIQETQDDEEYEPSMWLSLLDTANRAGDNVMIELAGKKFASTFKFESL